MTEVVSIRFKRKGKVYYFDPAGYTINSGDPVIVETSKGIEYAECTAGNHTVEDSAVVQPLRPVVRPATPEDIQRAEDNRQKEKLAFDICTDKIQKHELDMKLVDVEYSFDGSKLLFFFTSDGRVDFRDLVKDLAAEFKTRIELRQIGVRDEARLLGGLGICGRPFCCAQFLDDFQPVSIKMAKVQGLSLNPTKISGACGRLMCCLKYEQDAYESLVKNVPKIDSFVNTPKGKGMIIDVNLLRGNVRVKLEDPHETNICTFNANEVMVLGGKAKRAEYLAAKAEGIELDETPYIPPEDDEDETADSVLNEPEDEIPKEPVPVEARQEHKSARKKRGSKQKGQKTSVQQKEEPKNETAAQFESGQQPEGKQEKSRSKPRPRRRKPKGVRTQSEKQSSPLEQPIETKAEQNGGTKGGKSSGKRHYYRRRRPKNGSSDNKQH